MEFSTATSVGTEESGRVYKHAVSMGYNNAGQLNPVTTITTTVPNNAGGAAWGGLGARRDNMGEAHV